MDQGHQLDIVKRTIRKRLHPFNIHVDITLHDDDTVTLSAKKRLGINIQHATIHSNNLVEAIWQLIANIEENFDQWIEQEIYGS